MPDIADKLSADQIKALASYLSFMAPFVTGDAP